ncbi:MAG: triose-phosphate isomerase [Saprospiraceae bacterium]|nr:triose-phosphate isomerase [Saprospiraceae bacterium]
MRTRIAAGNWKMHKTESEAVQLARTLAQITIPPNVEVILGVPFVFLSTLQRELGDSAIRLTAQNCHEKDSGAYTGEISAPMLRSIGVECVILGHSERRQQFGEDNDLLARKVDQMLHHHIQPIFCCGEPLEIRKAGTHVTFVGNQLQESLFHLSRVDFAKLIIAYEPIWAIGTGVTASPEQAQDMHQSIRQMITNQFDAETGNKIQILYGGSVKPANAKILFEQIDVDGGLVGGASLNADDFKQIILA